MAEEFPTTSDFNPLEEPVTPSSTEESSSSVWIKLEPYIVPLNDEIDCLIDHIPREVSLSGRRLPNRVNRVSFDEDDNDDDDDDDDSIMETDSVILACDRGLRRTRRTKPRRSRLQDSSPFISPSSSQDSLLVARARYEKQRALKQAVDRFPSVFSPHPERQEVSPLSTGILSPALKPKNFSGITGAVASPDLETLKPLQISNSAA